MDDVLRWFKHNPQTHVLMITRTYTPGHYEMCGGSMFVVRPGQAIQGRGFDEIFVHECEITEEMWDNLYRPRFNTYQKFLDRAYPHVDC